MTERIIGRKLTPISILSSFPIDRTSISRLLYFNILFKHFSYSNIIELLTILFSKSVPNKLNRTVLN